MNREDVLRTATAVLTVLCVAACDGGSGSTLPAVNEANCRTESINSMPVSEKIRREFASKCALGGSYTATSKAFKW